MVSASDQRKVISWCLWLTAAFPLQLTSLMQLPATKHQAVSKEKQALELHQAFCRSLLFSETIPNSLVTVLVVR